MGTRVLVAEDEALVALVTDLNMPQMGGEDLIRAPRALPPKPAAASVAVTQPK